MVYGTICFPTVSDNLSCQFFNVLYLTITELNCSIFLKKNEITIQYHTFLVRE